MVRVLYVEDDDFIREKTQEHFEKEGLSIVSFPDGDEALAYYRENKEDIDVIVTDHQMPKLPGLDLIKAIMDLGADYPPMVLATNLMDYALKRETEELHPGRIFHFEKLGKTFELVGLIETLGRQQNR